MAMEERGKGSERWSGAITNLTEMASNLESLQKLLLKRAVFVDEETFAKASLSSEQARTIKVLEQRVETLERELDAAITAAARARSEKRQAEAAQKAAELHTQEVTRELENTTKWASPSPIPGPPNWIPSIYGLFSFCLIHIQKQSKLNSLWEQGREWVQLPSLKLIDVQP
uniref:Uncharacterized protein n=1 Tax=Fagus sylvatica TaxID=28930 RepID=A0A2N9GK91_FAGSY